MSQNNWLFKNHPLFEGSNRASMRCMSSAFHEVQRWHIYGVVDRFMNTYVKFIWDSVYQ